MELEKWFSEECLWYEYENLNLNPRTHTINSPCMTVCDYNANIEEQRQVGFLRATWPANLGKIANLQLRDIVSRG